jgi:hypothetical protein
MRLFAQAAVAALAVLVALTDQAPAGRKSSPPSRPAYTPPVNIPRIPSNYRPNGNAQAKVVQVQTDVSFTFNADAGKVRTFDPPANFDDKGNIKKYTREELKKLKGDDPDEKKLAGYKSEFGEIRVGDVVQVTLSVFKKKSPARKPARKKAKDAKDAKDADKDKDDEAKDDKLAADEKKEGRWVAAAQFLGKVTQVENGNSESSGKMTVQVSSQTVVYGNARPPSSKQNVSAEKAQATLVIIGRRPPDKPAP